MQFKFLKIVGLFLLATTLTGCPNEDCNDFGGGISRKDDLIILTPLQTAYNVGDIVTFKISIPASKKTNKQKINCYRNGVELFFTYIG